MGRVSSKDADNCKQIGERIALARSTAGWSVTDVAAYLGCPPSAVVSCEYGNQVPTANELEMMAEIYGVTAEWLLSGEETPEVEEEPVEEISEVEEEPVERVVANSNGKCNSFRGLTEEERELLDRFRVLRPDRREIIWAVLNSFQRTDMEETL